ncbi:MAG: glycosyltransferase [Candidatus Hodarchaeota archaeon]
MGNRLKVAVVIVTYNRNKDCKDTLNSLLKSSKLPNEIIVVDDSSSTPFEFDHELVRILRHDQEIGLSASRNIGVKASNSDIIAFIDDDAIASKNWIKNILKTFKNNIGIAGGPVLPLYLTTTPKWWDEKKFGLCIGIDDETIIGCNLIIKKSVFQDIGYFNINLGRKYGKLISGEENEFIERAIKLGIKILFNPQIIVYHKVYPHRLTIKYLIERVFWQGKSDFIMKTTNYKTMPKIIKNIITNMVRCIIYPIEFKRYVLNIVRQIGYLFAITRII